MTDPNCLSVVESCDVLLESPHPEAQAQRAPPVTVTVPGEEMSVDLQGSDLWKRFHEIGTEMIITKAGRWENTLTLSHTLHDITSH